MSLFSRDGAVVELVLGSGSPRRIDLMRKLNLPFDILVPDVNERRLEARLPVKDPVVVVSELARAKAAAVSELRPRAKVIGADTAVVLDDVILGKPSGSTEALDMLTRLSGRWHEVVTVVEIRGLGNSRQAVVTTRVKMRPLSSSILRAYVETDEPLDKAGSYAIQGQGADFVEEVEGCLLNVVGFPLCAVSALLEKAGVASSPDPVELCRCTAEELRHGGGGSYRLSPHPSVGTVLSSCALS